MNTNNETTQKKNKRFTVSDWNGIYLCKFANVIDRLLNE